MRLCPKCGERPSRRPTPKGKIAHCEECWTAARRAHDQLWAERRLTGHASARLVRVTGWEDLPPEEIERRYQAARAQQRAQWKP